MARIRQKGTTGERAVAAILQSLGASYRLNVRSLPGSPDFANKSRRWAIFVHGCFWHRHTGCRRATIPKANREFWQTKFADNRNRDARAARILRSTGFRVAIVWECSLDDPAAVRVRLSGLVEAAGAENRRK
jgi:DNA mismatch endonuclease (patch repair protein)